MASSQLMKYPGGGNSTSSPRADLGALSKLPNELLFNIISQLDHPSLVVLSGLSSFLRIIYFTEAFKLLKFQGTQDKVADNLQLFLSDLLSPLMKANLTLIKNASFVVNVYVYLVPDGEHKRICNSLPLMIARSTHTLDTVQSLKLDLRALEESQIEKIVDYLKYIPKLKVKHLTLIDYRGELSDVIKYCAKLESLHLYSKMQSCPLNLEYGLITAADHHPHLTKLCVTLLSDNFHTVDVNHVSFIAENFVNLEWLVLNSPRFDKGHVRVQERSFERSFLQFLHALKSLKHLKCFAFPLPSWRSCSWPINLTNAQDISRLGQPDLSLRNNLADSLAKLLPELDEICIMHEYPNVSKAIRERTEDRVIITDNESEPEFTRFPSGVSEPFDLAPDKIRISWHDCIKPPFIPLLGDDVEPSPTV